ncbi:hypothetical protein EJ06DRAFT_105535 [Trichodelitschia bisporula]|uniref:REJ domain-containing protein n=1 Tax=Trichodelitschia bisporula TaxID=703511 RepID=A0A6G1HQT4_9PEZI|nr:hypothetical protein EJ06DRAFT_105535 [Trichodelitschia bisporula]
MHVPSASLRLLRLPVSLPLFLSSISSASSSSSSSPSHCSPHFPQLNQHPTTRSPPHHGQLRCKAAVATRPAPVTRQQPLRGSSTAHEQRSTAHAAISTALSYVHSPPSSLPCADAACLHASKRDNRHTPPNINEQRSKTSRR